MPVPRGHLLAADDQEVAGTSRPKIRAAALVLCSERADEVQPVVPGLGDELARPPVSVGEDGVQVEVAAVPAGPVPGTEVGAWSGSNAGSVGSPCSIVTVTVHRVPGGTIRNGPRITCQRPGVSRPATPAREAARPGRWSRTPASSIARGSRSGLRPGRRRSARHCPASGKPCRLLAQLAIEIGKLGLQFLDARMAVKQRRGLLGELCAQRHPLFRQAADQFRIEHFGRLDRLAALEHLAGSAAPWTRHRTSARAHCSVAC